MTLTDQQVLVTGATGFLGGALALRLAADGVRVRALARNPRKAEFLRERAIEVLEGDVTDREAMRQAVQGCRVVFHVAASLGGSYAQHRAVNVEGTRNVVHAAAFALAIAGRAPVQLSEHPVELAAFRDEMTVPAVRAGDLVVARQMHHHAGRNGLLPYV